MGIMYSALQELSVLSLELENRDISLVEAHTNISSEMHVFEGIVNKSGNIQ
jgi:hypothetical protein